MGASVVTWKDISYYPTGDSMQIGPYALGPIRALCLLSFVWGGILASGCVRSAKKNADAAGPKLSAADSKTLEEYQAEIEIGRNMAGRLLGHYGRVEDDRLVGYINQVGNYVASYGDYPERRYMFAVLNHESINAFACPGGYILVTVGALRNAETEAELAMVLGHEVAHVGKKHMFDTLRNMKETELAETAKARSEGAKVDPSLAARRRVVPAETGAGAMLARYLSGSAGASLNILQAAQAGMSLITEKGLDKKLEYEADREGVKYTIRAGYDPKAMLDYLQRADEKSEKKVKNLEKTHPPVKQRKRQIAELLKSLNADQIVGATGKERFEKFRQSLPNPDK